MHKCGSAANEAGVIDKVAYVSANMATEESDGNMQSYTWADVEVAEVIYGLSSIAPFFS